MAKAILLYFENDEHADNFLSDWDAPRQGIFLGAWKFPTIFCDCPPGTNGGKGARGRKYGWWMCSKCNKSMHVNQSPKNLLMDWEVEDKRSGPDKRSWKLSVHMQCEEGTNFKERFGLL